MKEGSPRTPDSSHQSSEKSGGKSKSKERKLRAPIPDAKITEAKEASRADAPAPKVPLYEMFATDTAIKQEAAAAEKENAEAKPKKSRKAKKETAKETPEHVAEPGKTDNSAETKAEQNSPDAVEGSSEAVTDAETSEAAAEAETPADEPEAEPADEGLMIIERDEARSPETAEISLEEANEYRDDEPAPVVAPPIMFDIPLRPTQQAEIDPTLADPESFVVTEAEQPEAAIIPPIEETPAPEAFEPRRVEIAPLNIVALEQQNVAVADAAEASAPVYAAPEAPTPSEKRAVAREKADAELYAEKRGLGRGVTSGALVGYIFGRRRGRINAERAAKQEIEKRDDKIEGLEAGQRASETRSNLFTGTIERLQGQVRALEQRAKAVVTRPEKKPAETVERAERAPKQTYEYNRGAAETMKNPEKPKTTPEVKPEDKVITEETYAAPEGKRFETSAWHRYEVDKQTGKLVEDPELVYGKEFKQEQKQERLQTQPADAASTQQLGHAVVVGASVSEPRPTVVDSVTAHTQANLQPELNPYQPPHQKIEPKEMLKEVKKHIQQPIIWLAALVIVALLFAFGILH